MAGKTAGFDLQEATKSINGIGTATIRLGEREYVIQERKRQAQAEWRKRFEDAFEAVSDLIVLMLRQVNQDVPGLGSGQGEEGELAEVTPEEEQAQVAEAKGFLIKLLSQANNLVADVLDQALDLLVSYSLSLEKDRDYILSEVYDSQIVDALVEVLKLAYPFGSLVTQLGKMGRLPASGLGKSKT
jgi:hypothetical protein